MLQQCAAVRVCGAAERTSGGPTRHPIATIAVRLNKLRKRNCGRGMGGLTLGRICLSQADNFSHDRRTLGRRVAEYAASLSVESRSRSSMSCFGELVQRIAPWPPRRTSRPLPA